jgi:hypothetical protein
MTQVDPGINLKNPKKQDEVPTWYKICADLAYHIECKRYGWIGQQPGSGFFDLAPSILHYNWF